ncbi:hypothetical protein DL93DRAFT_2082070 [Clavulina sp. PMI_390]|nr:hypothetical protein DL93DRAFT_2082070 [Clavulina sp. PMI_390]
MSAGSGGKTGGFAHANGSGLGTGRLPAINQLNVVEDDLPNSITEYAEKEKIALVSHSDELGTQRQFVNLLLEFKDVIPLPEKLKAQEFTSVHEVFRMRWVLKYTIFLPERGLVADNGYVICADFP